MMLNDKLNARISTEGRGAAFDQLRNWLYWDFIQELVKICADSDPRSPSIRNIKTALGDEQIIRELRRKYTLRTPISAGKDYEVFLRRLHEEEQRVLCNEFDQTLRGFHDASDALLASEALAGYATIRDKLIAHNELRHAPERHGFFDIAVLKLKYGQERELLEQAREIVDAIELLVRTCSFAWDSFIDRETRNVCTFWQIEQIEEQVRREEGEAGSSARP